MRDEIDHLLAQFASAGPERSLEGFEQAVLSGISHLREDARTAKALAPARVASVGVALAIGITTGGIAAATTVSQPRQVSPFSAAAHLAPSTLLEGG